MQPARGVLPGHSHPHPNQVCFQGKCECEPGFFVLDGASGAACEPCPLGDYCAEGSVQPMPCDAGSLGGRANLTSQGECSACPVGAFCTSGASEPEPCAAGRFGNATNQTSAQCVGACAAGHWCEAGSTSATAAACGKGHFNPSEGAASAEACQPCSAGSAAGEEGSAPVAFPRCCESV